mgnify:CR=1 FL=1
MVTSDLRSLGLAESDIPFQKQISNRISYFRSQHLQFNNEISPLEETCRLHTYTGTEESSVPFIYLYDKNNVGQLTLGDGSDRHPFVLGFTSKAILSVIPVCVLNQNKLKSVFHMDSTFKCNDNEFPIFILGLTDAQHQFHPVSFNILSHHRASDYVRDIEGFKG